MGQCTGRMSVRFGSCCQAHGAQRIRHEQHWGHLCCRSKFWAENWSQHTGTTVNLTVRLLEMWKWVKRPERRRQIERWQGTEGEEGAAVLLAGWLPSQLKKETSEWKLCTSPAWPGFLEAGSAWSRSGVNGTNLHQRQQESFMYTATQGWAESVWV